MKTFKIIFEGDVEVLAERYEEDDDRLVFYDEKDNEVMSIPMEALDTYWILDGEEN